MPREVTFKEAVLEALREEMARDPAVILLGEDVGAAGGVFRQTAGLYEAFGARRVIDTPISESAIVGAAVGAAMTGLRPVVEIMFGDFITLALDQLVNQAAKVRFLSQGGFSAPLVLRTAVGVGGNLGAQHSQSLHAWVAHVPGLRVAVPATPADGKAMMVAALRGEDPVVFIEDRSIYNTKGPVDVPVAGFGQAALRRSGGDLTLVGISRGALLAAQAADLLAEIGIGCDVIDVRTLAPLDLDTLRSSLRKTGRAAVVDPGHRSFGAAAELAARLSEELFDYLDAPVVRVAAPDFPVPFSPALEPSAMPTARLVAEAALRHFPAGVRDRWSSAEAGR